MAKRKQKKVNTYFSMKQVKKIFIENNQHIDPSTVTTVFIHDLFKKKYPDRCPTYQTLINLNGQTGKQFDVFMCLKDIVGAKYMDDLIITIPE